MGFAFGVVLLRFQSLRPLAIATFVGATLFAFFFGPMLFCDRVTIDDEAISQRTGFWFAPTRNRLEFEGTLEVYLFRSPKGSRPVNTTWQVVRRDGTTREFDPGDLWDRNEGAILNALRDRHIQVRLGLDPSAP